MPRLPAVSPEHAAGRAKELLGGVQATLGMIPNLTRTMANSPAVPEAYLNFIGALAMGSLPATLREQIALAVAEVNGCDYCLAAHATTGKMVGLNHQDILDSRQGISPDRRVEAALQFARTVHQPAPWTVRQQCPGSQIHVFIPETESAHGMTDVTSGLAHES